MPQRTADAERNELPGGLLDEARHDRVISVARKEFPEAAAVRVGREPVRPAREQQRVPRRARDRKSTRLNSSHGYISYAVFCLKKKKTDHKKAKYVKRHS